MLATPKWDLLLKPNGVWDGDPSHKFLVKGKSDSNYVTDVTNHCSVTRYSVFLEGAPVAQKSGQQGSVTLFTAEAKLAAGTACVQTMLYVMCILQLMGLKVKKPTIILEINNKGAVDLAKTRVLEEGHYTLKFGNISYENYRKKEVCLRCGLLVLKCQWIFLLRTCPGLCSRNIL
jgi:hypothetical protein